MKLFTNKHFRNFIESHVTKAWMTQNGLNESAARAKFKDTIYEDYNLLAYALENVFPNTRSEGDNYIFVSNDCIHTNLATKRQYNVGRVEIDISKGEAYIKFPDVKGFRHGHIEEGGRIHCYGTYLRLYPNTVKMGFSTALLDSYAFASVSKDTQNWGSAREVTGV